MTQINPLTGSVIQSTQVQPRQSADKDRQIRRLQNLGKNAALQGDRLEHQVESTDAQQVIQDSQDSSRQQRRPPRKPRPTEGADEQDGQTHMDLKA
jgi:hypothetical protein